MLAYWLFINRLLFVNPIFYFRQNMLVVFFEIRYSLKFAIPYLSSLIATKQVRALNRGKTDCYSFSRAKDVNHGLKG